MLQLILDHRSRRCLLRRSRLDRRLGNLLERQVARAIFPGTPVHGGVDPPGGGKLGRVWRRLRPIPRTLDAFGQLVYIRLL
jgi:hypothetical protein